MKHIKFSVSVFSFISVTLSAQWMDTVTFEKNKQLVKIDNSQPNNIWQIGKPQKVFFNTALSTPIAILTDTINPYPINNISSFQFVIKEPTPSTWGNGMIPLVHFDHKYDTDTKIDGGYVEISYDGGSVWNNIANSPEIFVSASNPYDTIKGGIRGWSGHSDWDEGFFYWHQWCSMTPSQIIPDSIIVKFTFMSDGIQTNKEGWMIDDIIYGTSSYACFLGINDLSPAESLINISPNPSSTILFIENKQNQEGILQIIDMLGKEMNNEKMNNGKMQIDISNLPTGIYFVRIQTTQGVISKKIEVQR